MSNNVSLEALSSINNVVPVSMRDLYQVVFIVIMCFFVLYVYNKLEDKFNKYLAKSWNDIRKANRINKKIEKENKK